VIDAATIERHGLKPDEYAKIVAFMKGVRDADG